MSTSVASTYFISDERMLWHKNDWDPTYIETPRRLSSILDILVENQVLERCTVLESKEIKLDDLYLVHSANYVEEICQTQFLDKETMEKFCSMKEDIYVNEHTWQSALLAAGSSVELLRTVLRNPGSNGFAAVRPPGHHASRETPCGFCIFNNVAICAKKARQMGLERVLIFDWDVHAAQGTQYCIEDDSGIKLISIHRFENGAFWPELPESAVEQPYKNTINVPLNHIGYGDAEYAAILNYLVMPIICDWQPQLILVSCGFDAALGDPQGEMAISPGGYGYMTGTLAALGIPLVMLLEGGYFIESVAKGALYSMQALLEKRQLQINLDLAHPSEDFMKLLLSILSRYAPQFPSIKLWMEVVNKIRKDVGLPEIVNPSNEYRGHRELIFPYRTRNLYKSRNEEETERFHQMILTRENHYAEEIPEKPVLSVELNARHQFILNNNEFVLQLSRHDSVIADIQLNVLYFYALIPLSFSYTIEFVDAERSFLYKLENGLYDAVQPRSDKGCLSVDTFTKENDVEFVSKIAAFLDYNFFCYNL